MKLSHRRTLATAKRQSRREMAQRSAAAVLGPITKGMEVFALTGGQFSLVDVLVHVLDATGPADVAISTWTAASADIGFAAALLREKRIRSLRFLVDFSFPSRQPAYCAALAQTFGEGCIRVTKNHAKFLLIRSKGWDVVVRTSMNLNENRRCETVEVSEDAGLAAFLDEFLADVFRAQEVGGLKRKPGELVREFAQFVGQALDMDSTDVRKVMGDGTFATDVRRAGVSYVRGGA